MAPSTSDSKGKETRRNNSSNSGRYSHDVALALAMKGSKGSQSQSQRSVSSSEDSTRTTNTIVIREEDVNKALQGLNKAESLEGKGQHVEALKAYEDSLEVLIRFLRAKNAAAYDSNLRNIVQRRASDSLTRAENVKKLLTKNATRQPAAESTQEKPSGSNYFGLITTRGGRRQATEPSPTSAKSPSASASSPSSATNTRRTSPLAASKTGTVKLSTNSNSGPRPAVQSATAARRTTPSSQITQSNTRSQRSTTAATNLTDMQKTVLSDLYVAPENLQETQLDDIAGLQTVKQALQESAILPLVRPDLFTGLRKPQNILLYGPPGTGKTMLVRAVAKESNCPLFVCTASAMMSKWMGEGEKLVRALFETAQQVAPSIVFLDEVDALLSNRKSDGEHEASRRMKTEFMVQMDGIKSKGKSENSAQQQQVLVLACTNTPWDVDSAVLRRFPRRILVPLPDSEARSALFKHLLEKAGKHNLTDQQVTKIVQRTEGFSGSDLAAIASEAAFGPLRSLTTSSKGQTWDAIRNVHANDVRPIQLQDFEAAIAQATKSVGPAQLRQYDEWQRQQQAS